ncbi:MAG: cellulase family glycosylhydrolase [Kiritimatiellae bacterium]|nr:cellulase family glycosylhydrolase [Kiritimatiellia bacterium]
MTTTAGNRLPRWRGFNLLYFFSMRSDCTPQADDIRWIADWGFDFVRLPMCYRLWTEGDDVTRPREDVLARIDQTVELCREQRIHVCLNFHRAPGYSVNRERDEPFDLWKDRAALDAFIFHWQLFANRYKGMASDALSFNLVNEPRRASETGMTRADHERVMRATVAKIREADPDRLVILDGLAWGREPLPELADLNVAQSCRGYDPMHISHYKAPWVKGDRFAPAAWPGRNKEGELWDRARLEGHYAPWAALTEQGVGVHCGECGGYNKTPHPVFLAWFADVLEALAARRIGYALWNFRGSFGILDSEREDVAYEDWHGHKLDRKLLDLLQRH